MVQDKGQRGEERANGQTGKWREQGERGGGGEERGEDGRERRVFQ